jgi:hypothetical protein
MDNQEQEICGGAVGIVLARMETHPEEFFTDCDKWKFIYKDYFREVMTETEKGMIFDRIKAVRRTELSQTVLTTLVGSKNEERKSKSDFGSAPMKAEGQKIRITQTDEQMARHHGMTMTEYAEYKKRNAGL